MQSIYAEYFFNENKYYVCKNVENNSTASVSFKQEYTTNRKSNAFLSNIKEHLTFSLYRNFLVTTECRLCIFLCEIGLRFYRNESTDNDIVNYFTNSFV